MKRNIIKGYQTHDKKLLMLVKTKGILVKTMPLGTNFSASSPSNQNKYNLYLGAVCVRNWHKDITNVYRVYVDWDETIKYYDYPQITEKIAKKLRSGLEESNNKCFSPFYWIEVSKLYISYCIDANDFDNEKLYETDEFLKLLKENIQKKGYYKMCSERMRKAILQRCDELILSYNFNCNQTKSNYNTIHFDSFLNLLSLKK